MVWKSNLDENEQEFIEDFGAKSAADQKKQPGGVPVANRPPTAKKAPKQYYTGGKSKVDSPVKPQPGAAQDAAQLAPADEGVGGSGEELAQTLEKIVSQLDIISRTVHVLE